MGSRVRNVMNELHGEKIDIVDYAEDPASFVANALSPARVSRVHVVDAATREAQVIVPDYQLSLAIGKEGQNARLAARLTGWRIDIRSDAAVSAAPEDSPATPDAQHAPDAPDAQHAPDAPEAQHAPDAQHASGVPEAQHAPEAPGTPDAPDAA